MKYTFIIIFIVFGCASGEKMRLPDGGEGFYVKCPRSKKNCYDKAEEICNGSYKVVDQTDASTITSSSGIVVTAKKYEMMIKCKK